MAALATFSETFRRLEFLVASATRLPLDPDDATQAPRVQPSSDANSCNWLKPKYPAHPRSSGFRSAIIRSRLTPRCRRVRSRTRSLNRATALSAMRRRGCGSSVTVKPRNDRCHGRATALFCALICKFEPSLDEAGQTRHDARSSLFAADIDVAVIRVTHEPVATTFKFAVQLVQHEVRKQRRERTTLRGALPAGLEQPVGPAHRPSDSFASAEAPAGPGCAPPRGP